MLLLSTAMLLIAVDASGQIATSATGQSACPANVIAGANVTDAVTTLEVVLIDGAGVVTSQPLAGTIQVGAGPAVPVRVDADSPRILVFNLPEKYPGGTTIQYALGTATLICSPPSPTVAGTVTVQGNAQAIEDLLQKISYSKTAEEKDIFGSFFVARGEDGQAAGAADIVINRDLTQGRVPTVGLLFDTAFTTIRIKKTSAEKADPRAFDAAVTLQKTLLLGSAREYLVACSLHTTAECMAAQAQTATDSAFTRFFRALLFDEALRLESDAFSFESVNFVSDTHVQLGSQAKAVTNSGYLSLRLHAGAEIGRSLQKPSTAAGTSTVSTAAVDWIRRGKGGGEVAFKLIPGDNTGSSWAVEFSARAVARRLFTDEVFIEQLTNADNETVPTRVSVGRGTKIWREVDAKVFLFSTAIARYGLRLAYMNGSLPPTFKPTKGMTFGFVVETADDMSSGRPANVSN
jgi:hypothetical protein